MKANTKAMTLLRAMSEIDAEMMEAALNAGKGGTAKNGEPSESKQEPAGETAIVQTAAPERFSIRHLRISGWIAAAACLILVIGAACFFRQDHSGLVLQPSVAENIVEITGTEPPQTTVFQATLLTEAALPAETGQQTTVTAVSAAGEEPAHTAEAKTDTVPAETRTAAETVTETASEAAVTETTTAVTYAEYVPVLVAMGDECGTLTEETAWEIVTDKEAITAYLNGTSPEVTLGEGQKDAAVTAEIMANCSMLRIRWQQPDHSWASYGITGAELDADGVLHLSAAMYDDGTPHEEAEWIYETGLLFAAGSLPQITDVRLELKYYSDFQNGITAYLSYQDALQDDVHIHIPEQ